MARRMFVLPVLVAVLMQTPSLTPARARDWRAPEPWPVAAPRLLMIGDSQVYGPVGDAV